MKKREKDNLKKNFRGALRYLRESSNYIWAIALIFVAGGILGVVYSANLSFLDEFLKQIIEKTEGMGALELTVFIFSNNFQSAFMGLILGLVLGIFPVITSVFNGVLLGYVMKQVSVANGIGELWRILPHGIFELPAIFISLALGLKLGMVVFSKNRMKNLRERALYSLILLFSIVLPLLIVAAIIEGVLIFVLR